MRVYISDRRLNYVIVGILLGILAITAAAVAFQRSAEPKISVTYRMSTVIQQQWYGRDADKMINSVNSLIEELESELSLYIEGSEIDRINENAGIRPVAVSEDVFDLISRSKAFCSSEDAARLGFDITIAPITLAWDVAGDNPHVPGTEQINGLLQLINWRDIQLEEESCEVMLAKKGQKLDLGAIAKGYICGRAGELAQDYRLDGGYLSVGGNVYAIGEKTGQGKFTFGIQDPRGYNEECVGYLEMPADLNGGEMRLLATSGDYERYFEADGVRYHHIFDAHTGYPKETDLISVTILTGDGFTSDAMSTLLFMGGTKMLPKYRNAADFGFVAIDSQGYVYLSDNLAGKFQLRPDMTGYQIAAY